MKARSFPSRPTKHLIGIAAAGIVLALPVLILGIPIFSDDGVTHAMWYSRFSEQLWSGDLYPRWLMNMNGGLGSPVFFYNPPVPFFLTSLLRPLFANDPQGWHQVGVSCAIALVASGISAYFWLKEISDPKSAIVAAVLFMAMPYHLADLYMRGAMAELWAFVWLPLILFFTYRIARGRWFACAGLAVSYALLVMTHLPTTLIFSVVPIGYVLFTANRELSPAPEAALWTSTKRLEQSWAIGLQGPGARTSPQPEPHLTSLAEADRSGKGTETGVRPAICDSQPQPATPFSIDRRGRWTDKA